MEVLLGISNTAYDGTEIIYKCPRCGQEFPTKNLTYPKKENIFFYCSKERKIQ